MDTSKLSIEEVLQLARLRMKEKNPGDAHRILNDAYDRLEARPVRLLDCLVSVALNLGDEDMAMGYATEMCQTYSTSALAYLRCAQVAKRQSDRYDSKKVIAICDRGLKKATPSDEYYEILKRLRQDFLSKTRVTTRTDPLTVFPAEITEMILSYLEFRERARCIGISKPWRAYLTSIPRIWKSLDFFGTSYQKQMRIPASFVKNCVRWSQYQLEEARIDAYSHLPTLLDVARSCKRLKVLRIGPRSNLNQSAILQISALCKGLESIHLPEPSVRHSVADTLIPRGNGLKSVVMGLGPWVEHLGVFTGPMPNLTRLHLRGSSSCPNHFVIDLGYLLKSIPSVSALGLARFQFIDNSDFRPATNLSWLELTDCVIHRQLTVPETLKSLMLSVRGWKPELGPAPLPALEELRLRMVDVPACDVGYVIATRSPLANEEDSEPPEQEFSKLKTLVLEGPADGPDATGTVVKTALLDQRLREVETLDLDIMMRDAEVREICEHYGNLRVVAIGGGHCSGVAIKHLVETQRHIQHIRLYHYVDPPSPDAVAWARREGVSVSVGPDTAMSWDSHVKPSRDIWFA